MGEAHTWDSRPKTEHSITEWDLQISDMTDAFGAPKAFEVSPPGILARRFGAGPNGACLGIEPVSKTSSQMPGAKCPKCKENGVETVCFPGRPCPRCKFPVPA